MKKLLLTVVLMLVFGLCTCFTAWAENPITVTVDGQTINFDVQPRLIGGRTMVPLRAIFEALGATVEWNETSQTVTAYNEAYIVKCTIDSNTMYINSKAKTMDVAPMMIDSRTFVPARFVAEAFNCNVNWDDNAFVVAITTNPIDYSKVEQETNNTGVSATMVPDTVYKPANARYYPGTNVPDYTYLTGVEQKRAPYYSDNGWVLYSYRHTKSGKYSEVADYMGYLEENGWSLYSKDEDHTKFKLNWFYANDRGEYVGVVYNAEYDEITIGVEGY